MVVRVSRPTTLEALTPKIELAAEHGSAFIVLAFLDNKPFEIFVYMGKGSNGEKSSPHEKAWLEALTRSISIGLQSGVPVKEYVEQLRNIECDNGFSNGKRLKSPADAIASLLAPYVEKEEVTSVHS